MNFLGSNNQNIITFGFSPNNEINFLRDFLPTDLPNLQVWLDAEEGVINAAGVPAESVSIEVFTSEVVYSEELDESKNVGGVYNRVSTNTNGKNAYQSGQGDFIFWNGSKWILEVVFDDGNGGEFFVNIESDNPNSLEFDYPWEATWSALGQGGSVERASPENDIAATNNQTVEQWNNKAPGKPNLVQPIFNLRPIFSSNSFGRKNVAFSTHALYNSNFSNFGQQYSYYLVATTFGTGASAATAIKLSPVFLSTRGAFGSSSAALLNVSNGNTNISANLSKNINNNFGIFSARFNLSNAGQVIIGRNLINEVVTLNDTTSANTSVVVIGGRSTSVTSFNITSRFSEILIYNSFHDNATAQRIINYLVQKWNINTSL